MRPLFPYILLCLAFGCGHTQFESPREEEEYLASLSNPTPDQFLRHKALVKVRLKLREESEERERLAWLADAPQREAAAQAAAAKQEAAAQAAAAKQEADVVAILMRDAKDKESKGSKADFALAARWYKAVVDKHPSVPEAALATERYKLCWKQAYGEEAP